MATKKTLRKTSIGPSSGRRRRPIPPAERGSRVRELAVVFDTNALFTSSEGYLVNREVQKFITSNKHPDLALRWVLPEIVVEERRYQMCAAAIKLLDTVVRLERLLSRDTSLTEGTIRGRIDELITKRQDELGVTTATLDYSSVDLADLISDAVNRRPPFEKNTEKGFRDAVLVETLLQYVLANRSADGSLVFAFVSADSLVLEAVKARIGSTNDVVVVSTLDALQDHINALVSHEDPKRVDSLRPVANALFFSRDVHDTLYYKFNVRHEIETRFVENLREVPAGASSRKDDGWFIAQPVFLRKQARRVVWRTRVEVKVEAFARVYRPPVRSSTGSIIDLGLTTARDPYFSAEDPSLPTSRETPWYPLLDPSLGLGAVTRGGRSMDSLDLGFDDLEKINISTPHVLARTNEVSLYPVDIGEAKYGGFSLGERGSYEVVKTHEGRDAYDVTWSAELSPDGSFSDPKIESYDAGGATWERV